MWITEILELILSLHIFALCSEVLFPPLEIYGSYHLISLLIFVSFPPGQSESVRDVQFSMKDYFTFAASFENGNVQLWDIRRPDRYERMFTAHTGPVFCCDWHPDDRYKK